MIISKTPFRMSFFGGGTDMEDFFRENGGAVLSTTFDKYCYVNVRHLPRFFDYSTELAYSKTVSPSMSMCYLLSQTSDLMNSLVLQIKK